MAYDTDSYNRCCHISKVAGSLLFFKCGNATFFGPYICLFYAYLLN